MVLPTLLMASHGKQILGNHPLTYEALKPTISFIGGSAHREGMLQGADGGFTAGPPAQRSSEPALLLLLGPLRRESSAYRQRHLLHPKGVRLLLVFGGKASPVAGRHLRRSTKTNLMVLERRHPGHGIGRIARQYLVAPHDPVLHLVHPDTPTYR